jgi:hypothetical protein
VPSLPRTLTAAGSRGQTQASSPAERRSLEPTVVAEQKTDRQAKVHSILAVVRAPTVPSPTPPSPSRGEGGGAARSGFAQSAWGVLLDEKVPRSILRAPIEITIDGGARRVNLLGAVTPGAGSGDTEYTWTLLVDGNVVAALVAIPAHAEGLSMPLNFSESLPDGKHTFDIRAIVNHASGAPKATGTLTVIATP